MTGPEAVDVWDAPDGTRWIYFPAWDEWTGWVPHEDGHWQLSSAEFRASYPDAPRWEAGVAAAASAGQAGARAADAAS